MPIDNVRWTNCRNCGHRYADYVKRCPRCGASTKSAGLKVGAAVGAIAGVVAVIAIIMIAQPSFLSSFSNPKSGVIEDSKIETNNPPSGLAETGNSGNSDVKPVQLKEYTIENKTEVLVQRSAFLGLGDSYSFEFDIPNENVTYLDGTVTVEGKDSVQATFLDGFDSNYCDNERDCTFTVFGSQSGKKSEEINHDVHLLVDRGDSIKLYVKNAPSAQLQIVKVNLLVTYPIVVEKTTTTPEIVPVVEDKKETPQSDEPTPKQEEPEQQPVSQDSSPTLQELRKHALDKINEDREKYDLDPVELSDNEAAQAHAEDMLKTLQISHWMTNGEKPYMTYTRYGGTGSVGQNVALSGDWQYAKDCSSGFYICETMNPYKEIESHEYAMMYDDASSNWGHRDNIIDKHHTHVSIGIAYNAYAFVMVQNFENNYIESSQPVSVDDEKVKIVGKIDPDYDLYGVLIYYDDLPTSAVYERYKDQGYYAMGDMVAGVVPPDGSYYPGIKTVAASNWRDSNGSIDIRFDLSDIAKEDGVYTIIVWLEDDKGEQFDATTYSVVVN